MISLQQHFSIDASFGHGFDADAEEEVTPLRSTRDLSIFLGRELER